MARALSLDLRRRVVEAVPRECLAGRRRHGFGISASSAIRWVAQIRSGGALAPMKQGGDRKPQRIEAEAAFILGAVARQPDLTLAELKAKLRERGMSVGIRTLWLFFQRHRITLKKRLRMPPSSCART
jgi:transposase